MKWSKTPLLFLCFYTSQCLAQTIGDFQSKKSGNWGSALNWETWNGTSWVAASTPPSNGATVTIKNPHIIKLDRNTGVTSISSLKINAPNGSLDMTSTAAFTLTITQLLENDASITVAGNTLELGGTVTGSGRLTSSGGTVIYNRAADGQGVLPGAYHHLIFNDYKKVLPSGTLTISGTFNPGTATGHTVNGSTFDFNSSGGQTVPPFEYHNLTISGTRTASVDFVGQATYAISGNFTTPVTFKAQGNRNGKISGLPTCTLLFNGTSSQAFNLEYFDEDEGNLVPVKAGTVIFRNNGGGVTANSALEVVTSTTVEGMLHFSGEETYIYGDGAFTVNSGATLGIKSVHGLVNAPFTHPTNKGLGNVRNLGLRSFDGGGHYIFTAGANGATGEQLPSLITGSLQMAAASSATISLTQSVTTASLVLTSAKLGLNGKTLSLSGTISRDGITQTGVVPPAEGIVEFNGATSQVLPPAAFNGTIRNLTINTTNGAEVTMNNNLTVTNDLTLTSGTLQTAGQSLTLSGPVSRTGGGVNATSGTVVFNGATAQSVPAGSFTGTIQNLTVNNASGVTLNSDRTVTGTLTLTSGALQFSGSALTMGDGSTINRSGGSLTTAPAWGASVDVIYTNSSNITTGAEIPASHVESVLKSLTLSAATGASVSLNSSPTVNKKLVLTSGTLNLNGLTLTLKEAVEKGIGLINAAAGTIVLSGIKEQTLPAATFSASAVQNLTINNPLNVNLEGSLTINGMLSLAAGTFTLKDDNLTLSGTSTLNGGSKESHIVITGLGSLIRKALTGSQMFPLGVKKGSFTSVSITNTLGLDWAVNLAAEVKPKPKEFDPETALMRTWNITPSGTPGPTNLVFRFNEAEPGIKGLKWIDNYSTTGGSLLIKHYSNTLAAWETASVAVPLILGENEFSVTLIGQTDFSPFTIATPGETLPVTYLSFSGKREAGVNVLQWQTAQESSNKGFEVERSPDGVHFSPIGFVASKAPGGNSTSPLSYSFQDKASSTSGPSLYYRLRQIDEDGKTRISPVVAIRSQSGQGFATLSVFPNPAQSILQVRVDGEAGGALQLSLIDAGGRSVLQRALPAPGGLTSLSLPLTTLQPGVYHLVLRGASGQQQTTSFVKQ